MCRSKPLSLVLSDAKGYSSRCKKTLEGTPHSATCDTSPAPISNVPTVVYTLIILGIFYIRRGVGFEYKGDRIVRPFGAR